MSHFLSWTVILAILSGCATANQSAVFHDKILDANPPSLVELLPAGGKPIHIGDNAPMGNWHDLGDIAIENRNPSPPLAYGWKFNLHKFPSKGGQLIISIDSLGPGHTGCPTIVSLNGKRVKDLNKLPNAGTGTTTFVKLSVSKEYFRPGQNQLVISEKLCVFAFHHPAYNDSLIKSVHLVLF